MIISWDGFLGARNSHFLLSLREWTRKRKRGREKERKKPCLKESFENIGKWRKTCKWIVIYRQHRPSMQSFYSMKKKISSRYSHADLWICAMCAYMWNECAWLGLNSLICKFSRKMAKTWQWYVKICTYSINAICWAKIKYPAE